MALPLPYTKEPKKPPYPKQHSGYFPQDFFFHNLAARHWYVHFNCRCCGYSYAPARINDFIFVAHSTITTWKAAASIQHSCPVSTGQDNTITASLAGKAGTTPSKCAWELLQWLRCSDYHLVTCLTIQKVKSFKEDLKPHSIHTHKVISFLYIMLINCLKTCSTDLFFLNQWNRQCSSMKFNKRAPARLRQNIRVVRQIPFKKTSHMWEYSINCGRHHVFYRMLGVEVLLQIRLNSRV